MDFNYSKGMGVALWEKMRENSDKIAQIDGLNGAKESYGSLLQRSVQTAVSLRSKGITSDDIIMTCSVNTMNSSIPFLAAQFLGAIISALDPSLSIKDVIHCLKTVPPKIIFVMPNMIETIENALEEIGLQIEIVVFGQTTIHTPFSSFLQSSYLEKSFCPTEVFDEDKTGLILFSSGTTGFPKGICLKNLGFLKNVKTSLVCADQFSDKCLATTSLFWITANLILTSCVLKGAARVILPLFNAENVWKAIENFEVHVIFAPPIQLLDLASSKAQLNAKGGSLKCVLTAGVKLFQEQIAIINSAFPNGVLIQIYGQTELGTIATLNPNRPEELKLMRKYPLSIGKILPCFSYKVVDLETRDHVKLGKSGELLLKGDLLAFNGYYKMDSKQTWDDEGWYKTGDLVYFNEDGCLFITDRVKEILKFQSWHVPPAVIEEILITHPSVESCLVVGIPHKIDGEHPMAVVVLKKSHQRTTPEEIQEFVEEQVDDRKKLRGGVRIIKKFPISGTGKIKRNDIRDKILLGEL